MAGSHKCRGTQQLQGYAPCNCDQALALKNENQRLQEALDYLHNQIETQHRGLFKLGDFVQLKLGGPRMVVENVTMACGRPDYTFCKWLNKNDDLVSGSFHPELLEHLVK